MKKKNLLYVAAFAIGLSLSGCSDSFLKDMKNYGAYGDETFDSESKVTWYVNSLYTAYFSGYKSPNRVLLGTWEDRDNQTIENWGITDFTNPTSSYTTAEEVTKLSDYFGSKLGTSPDTSKPYTRIRNCNILLAGLEDSSLSEDVKNKAKGQALFLRAMQLFDLVRTYGPVPIVTTVLNATAMDDANKLPRASVTQCIQQIVQDLNDAASMLPADWGAAEYGRLTSGAALAYKSRVLLTYASPIFNKNWDNPQDVRWANALKATLAAQSALTNNGLDGCSNAKEWEEMLSRDNNTFHKEAIIVKLLASTSITADEHNSWEGGIRLTSQEGKGGKAVPVELIDAFPMADGTRPVASAKIANGSTSFFLNRDPRFYRTFAFSGIKWGYKGNEDDVVWAYRWKESETSENYSYQYSDDNQVGSPAFVRKMSGKTTLTTDNYTFSGIDIYEYRYAELILNLAECYAATGNTSKAVEWLGEIRKRVGILPGSDGTYGIGNITDRHAAIEACLYERQIELAYEGKRCWDMWRWMLYDGGNSSNNTCNALGVEELNGTHRTSKYVDVKEDKYTMGSADPLAASRTELVADPDDADFQKQLAELQQFWSENFEFGDPDAPADKDNNDNPVDINWRSNYYIKGLSKGVLDKNSWLGQTKGWTDENGADGTIDWQDSEQLTIE